MKSLVRDIFMFEHSVQWELPLEMRINDTDLILVFFIKYVEIKPLLVDWWKGYMADYIVSGNVFLDVFW